MDSMRERNRRPRSKSQLLTLGGISAYAIDPIEIGRLAKLISHTPDAQLPKLLEALLTKRELVDIIRRVLIAEMVLQRNTYEKIYQDLKASPNTVSLVQQSLAMHNEILANAINKQLKHSHRETVAIDPIEKYFHNRIRKGK